jgi:hypothetical protein
MTEYSFKPVKKVMSSNTSINGIVRCGYCEYPIGEHPLEIGVRCERCFAEIFHKKSSCRAEAGLTYQGYCLLRWILDVFRLGGEIADVREFDPCMSTQALDQIVFELTVEGWIIGNIEDGVRMSKKMQREYCEPASHIEEIDRNRKGDR